MSDKKEWRVWEIEGRYIIPSETYLNHHSGRPCWCHHASTNEGPQLRIGEKAEVIEKAAFDAEKQRADSLQEKLDDEADLLVKTHNKLMEQRQRADQLEKELSEYATISYMMGAEDYKDKVKALKEENQKLKEALEKIACYVKPYDLTSEPIKMIETEEAMIAKEALK